MTDLINTIEAPGEFDALTSLKPGEPYFPLVGRDRLAPPLVQAWADKNRARALDEFASGLIDAETRDRELRKSTQAEAIGWSMQAFKAGNEAKAFIAASSSSKPTYSGHVVPEEQARRDRLQSGSVNAAAALHNAIAETNDLLELLKAEGEGGLEQAALGNRIESTLQKMRKLADEVTPKRAAIK